jgi:hypothetical protein
MGTVAGALGVYMNKQVPVVGAVDRLLRLTLLWTSSVVTVPPRILQGSCRKSGHPCAMPDNPLRVWKLPIRVRA